MSDGAGKYRRLMRSAIENVSRFFFDSFGRKNADFRARSGLKVTVIREEIGDCCSWCADLAGTYDYENVPKEAWQRHENCRCMVLTRTEKGTYQDAWSRKEYESERDARKDREEELLLLKNKGTDEEYFGTDIISDNKKGRMWKNETIVWDDNFRIENNLKENGINPDAIREDLWGSDIGKDTLRFLDAENAQIIIEYGKQYPHDAYGYYDPLDNQIYINGDKCNTTECAALTLIHEAKHMENRGKGKSVKEDEIEAYTAEAKHHLKRELTQEEIKVINNAVEEVLGKGGTSRKHG